MEEKVGLYIPIQVTKRKEFMGIEGIGTKEAINIGIALAIGFILGIILFFKNDSNPFFLFITIFIFGSIGYLFLKKDKTNRSTIDKLKKMILFMNGQKRFYFKYHNIYESRGEEIHEKKVYRTRVNSK